MNSNESHPNTHGASTNRGQKQHRETPFAAFAVLQAVLLCISATTSCTCAASIKSDFQYKLPTNQQQHDHEQEATGLHGS